MGTTHGGPSMLRPWLLAGGFAVATLASATAQTRAPVTSAPLAISPPSAQQEWERAERSREELGYQRERDRLDLERRQLQNEDSRDTGDRGLLGAPVFVPPGAAPFYAAPQYPGYGPGNAPGTYGPTTPSTAMPGRACRQTAPAYDEAGRFLATVCVR